MLRSGLGGTQDRGHYILTPSSSCCNNINKKSEKCFSFPTRSFPLSDDFAVLGLTPYASRTDVKQAYKRLALKYHPDVIKEENRQHKQEVFKEIKSAYESLMQKFDVEDELNPVDDYEEYDEWDEWMGFEGGIPTMPNTI